MTFARYCMIRYIQVNIRLILLHFPYFSILSLHVYTEAIFCHSCQGDHHIFYYSLACSACAHFCEARMDQVRDRVDLRAHYDSWELELSHRVRECLYRVTPHYRYCGPRDERDDPRRRILGSVSYHRNCHTRSDRCDARECTRLLDRQMVLTRDHGEIR